MPHARTAGARPTPKRALPGRDLGRATGPLAASEVGSAAPRTTKASLCTTDRSGRWFNRTELEVAQPHRATTAAAKGPYVLGPAGVRGGRGRVTASRRG